MKIWLDDERPMPAGFDTLVRHGDTAIEFLKAGGVTMISLDYDLGIGYTNGAEVAKYIHDAARDGTLQELVVCCHSGSYDGKKQIMEYLRDARKYWEKRREPTV